MTEIQKCPEDVKPTGIIEVDGLSCPVPLLRAKNKLAKLLTGDILQINSVDPDFLQDFKVWCERNGHNFLGQKEYCGKTSCFVKKG